MSRALVIKYGGTSVATPKRVLRAARRIALHARRRPVVAVVSAAGRSTDGILRWAAALGATPGRELDRALATGEDRSAALLAAALGALGVAARSLRGGEAGLVAEGPWGGAHVAAVSGGRLRLLLDEGVVPVVSGFQGERADGETVTLGRGGSDTSAVALAVALGASCDIVTDVDAVYDRDPRLGPGARRFDTLDHDRLVELTVGGAWVVHPEAARLAKLGNVPLRIYHHAARSGDAGTRVGTPAAEVAPVVGRRLTT